MATDPTPVEIRLSPDRIWLALRIPQGSGWRWYLVRAGWVAYGVDTTAATVAGWQTIWAAAPSTAPLALFDLEETTHA